MDAGTETKKKAKKILVAVHGMGDQTPFKTLQDVVHQVFGANGMPQGVPIGRLHSDLLRPHHGSGKPHPKLWFNQGGWSELSPLPDLGFAEVFWADIAREHEKYVLEDVVRWADTIVHRIGVVENQYRQAVQNRGDPRPSQKPIRKALLQRVLRDIGMSVRLLRYANKLGTHAGVGSVNLDDLLVRYLGDVQLFAEYEAPRRRVLERFHAVMEGIHARAQGSKEPVEVHICAHSWGSVVAFLGLLEGRKNNAAWLDSVTSFMTIGSPIDKGLVLWPQLWGEFVGLGASGRENGIKWWNFSDKGDPVAHDLDFARDFVQLVDPNLFADQAPEDHNFRRYKIPGKAHIDYWTDGGVFDKWFAGIGVVNRKVKPPKSRELARCVSFTLVLLFPFFWSWAAAHCIGAFLNGIAGNSAEFMFASRIDLAGTLSLAALLHGMIAFGNSQGLGQRWFWLPLGGLAAGLGAWLAVRAVGRPAEILVIILGIGAVVQLSWDWLARDQNTSPFARAFVPATLTMAGVAGFFFVKVGSADWALLAKILTYVFVTALAGWAVLHLLDRRGHREGDRRTTRLPGTKRTLMWCIIVAAVAGIVVYGTKSMGPGAAFSKIALLGLATVCWALAVLFWNLTSVWLEYLSTGRHMQKLRERWNIQPKEPKRKGGEEKSLAPEKAQEPKPKSGLWWMD